MTTDTLRRAAALMREHHAHLCCDDARHRGDFHLAVADWLDTEADEFDRYMARQIDPERRFASIWLDSARARHKHALTVARAYLGGETP